MEGYLSTPFGGIRVRASDNEILEVIFSKEAARDNFPEDSIVSNFFKQIKVYFADPKSTFSIDYRANGTSFRERVWHEISLIPSGSTRTYGQIANKLGSSARAVGMACGDNPVPLLIPCHRVVAKSGIGGFNHSIGHFEKSVKLWLLNHERAVINEKTDRSV